MTRDPNEDEPLREENGYLHFEDDNPAVEDLYFTNMEEALEFLNDQNWSLASEDWLPSGLFERKIECMDPRGYVMGQLMMLTVKPPKNTDL